MIKIIYIGKEDKNIINIINKISNIKLNVIKSYNYDFIKEKISKDVDIFIFNNLGVCCVGLCEKFKKEYNNAITISIVLDISGSVCDSDLIINRNINELEFYFQLILLIKLIDDNKKLLKNNKKLKISNKLKTEKLENIISILKATFESTTNGILIVDTIGNIVDYNDLFVKIWGLPKNIIEKKDDFLALDYASKKLENPEEFVNYVKNLYKTDKESYKTLFFKDGRIYESYTIQKKINHELVGRVWTFRDITDRIEYENNLIKSKEKIEELYKTKTQFLNNISHNIRTPLNLITGFSSLINNKLSDGVLIEYINIVNQSSNKLVSIIDNMLNLSEIQSGTFKTNNKIFNPKNTIIVLESDFINLLEFMGKNNLKISYKVPKKNIKINSDEEKIKKVLYNLIENSIKFTSNGFIEYGYKICKKEIIFYVKDTGKGISEDESFVFNKFFIENNKEFEGSGIGLTLSKKIIEILGGEMWYECKNQKTTFYFTIPIKI